MFRIGDETVSGQMIQNCTFTDNPGWTISTASVATACAPNMTFSVGVVGKEKPVRTLYEVYLVHRTTLEIVFERVIAKSEEAAMIKAAMKNKIEDVDLYDWTAVDVLTLSEPDDA
jgi:hypothetical protein